MKICAGKVDYDAERTATTETNEVETAVAVCDVFCNIIGG